MCSAGLLKQDWRRGHAQSVQMLGVVRLIQHHRQTPGCGVSGARVRKTFGFGKVGCFVRVASHGVLCAWQTRSSREMLGSMPDSVAWGLRFFCWRDMCEEIPRTYININITEICLYGNASERGLISVPWDPSVLALTLLNY